MASNGRIGSTPIRGTTKSDSLKVGRFFILDLNQTRRQMSNEIKCPNCGHDFEPNESIRKSIEEEVKKEANARVEQWKKNKEKELEDAIRKNLVVDFESKLRLLEHNNKEYEEKLKEARQQQVEILKKEQEIKTKEAELELSVQKKLQQERGKLAEEIRKLEEQRIAARETEYQLQLKELQKQLDDQKRLAEVMKRKAEQGSMQLQGEVQELALEEMLRSAFPFDLVTEVEKGVRGADCIQTVRNNIGQECGKIIFESKRTNAFANDWIEKLKTDMRSQSADVAVIVTQAMPKDMNQFGEKDGVWICTFREVKAVVQMLRDGIKKVAAVLKGQENKGDKMTLLYNYLTSSEFAEQWKAIREGFLNMKLSIQKERDAMERLWKAREKQLEKILLSASHIRGSVDGIAGMESVDLNLLENNTGEDEES